MAEAKRNVENNTIRMKRIKESVLAVDTPLHGKRLLLVVKEITRMFGSWCISTHRVGLFLLKGNSGQ